MFRARSQPADLAVPRECKDAEVRISVDKRRRLRGVVITEGGEDHRLSQHGGIDVEDGTLVFAVSATLVSVVAEQQPEIGTTRAGRAVISVAHRQLTRGLGARV